MKARETRPMDKGMKAMETGPMDKSIKGQRKKSKWTKV